MAADMRTGDLLAGLTPVRDPVVETREPQLHAEISDLAARADALALRRPDRRSELEFVAGYLRRMLK